jgi:hypothetical protein
MANVANQIWPHLPSDKPAPTQQQRGDLASAMYPGLAPKPKPPTNPYREALLRNLRLANAAADARLAREKRGR